MSLESQYRRLSRLYPSEWRDQNEEELIATLLDGAEPARRSVPPAEAIDLVRGAIILRTRASSATGADRRLRRAASIGLVLVAVLGFGWVVGLVSGDVSVEFLVTSLVVVVIPGTGVVYTVSSAIGGGRRRGLFAAIGCTLGIVPHVLAAMLGLSGVMQAGAVAFEAVRWVGVAYLAYMGLSMLRRGGALQLDDQRAQVDRPALVVRRGILLNLLNPKLTVFFFAFLPQFLDSAPTLLDARLIGLGAIFMTLTLAVFLAYAWASAAVRDRILGAPQVLRWVQRSLGGLLIAFAARLAVTDR